MPSSRTLASKHDPKRRKPRDALIQCACDECRRRKVKCDGTRPVCKQCQARHAPCHFAALSGETRTGALRRKLENAQAAADTSNPLASPSCSPAESSFRPRSRARSLSLQTRNHSNSDLYDTSLLATQALNYDHATDSIPQAVGAIDNLFEPSTPAAARESDLQISRAPDHLGQVSRNDESSNMRLVLDALVSESNSDSSAILARLRAGEEWGHVAQSISGQRTGQASATEPSTANFEGISQSRRRAQTFDNNHNLQACNVPIDSSAMVGTLQSSVPPLKSARSNIASRNRTLSLGTQAIALVNALARESDEDSSLLLACLRSGCPWDVIAGTVLRADGVMNQNLFARLNQPHLLSNLDPSSSYDNSTLMAAPEYYGSTLKNEYQTYDLEPPENIDRYRPWIQRRFNRNLWKQNHVVTRDNYIHNLDPTESSLLTSSAHHRLGNMALADAIGANHWPASTQAMQQRNLTAPPWAAQCIHEIDAPSEPFDIAFNDLKTAASSLGSIDEVCGTQVCFEALDDEAAFASAPLLSQIIASLILSIKSDEPATSVTQYALMWAEWTLWRWMLAPSPQTYQELPEIMKPSNSQLFISHRRMYDFIIWPALREHVCNLPDVDRRWLTEACVTVRCDLDWATEAPVSRNMETGKLELSPTLKPYVSSPATWSMGASVRPFLQNADSYARIRVPQFVG